MKINLLLTIITVLFVMQLKGQNASLSDTCFNKNSLDEILGTGIENAQVQVQPDGSIQLSRPYSLSQRPGQQIRPGTQWHENLYNNPNPINTTDWTKYDLTSGNQDNWTAEQRSEYLRQSKNADMKKHLPFLLVSLFAAATLIIIIIRLKKNNTNNQENINTGAIR